METKSTPNNAGVIVDKSSHLFGKLVTIIKQDAEWVYTEIKDGIDSIEAKFKPGQVQATAPLPEVSSSNTVVTAPVATTPIAPTSDVDTESNPS